MQECYRIIVAITYIQNSYLYSIMSYKNELC